MHRKSVCLCELWQEGEAYGKTAAPHPSSLLVMLYAFALIRVQVTPAAAERQERSDRVSEEASYHWNHYILPYAPQLHFSPAT